MQLGAQDLYCNDEAFAVVLPDRVINKFKCNLKMDNLAAMKIEFANFRKILF